MPKVAQEFEIYQILIDKIFIGQKEAGECACKLEHIISLPLIKKLDRFTDFFRNNLTDEQILEKLKEKLAKP